MIQVQIPAYEKSKAPAFRHHNIDSSTPSSQRETHDICCLVLIMFLALVFVGSLALGVKQRNVEQFLYPTGQDYRCGMGDAQQYPYAYFYNPLVNNKTVCVKKCPSMQANNQVDKIECYFKFKCLYDATALPYSQYSQKLSKSRVIGYPTYTSVGNICLPLHSVMYKSLNGSAQSIYTRVSYQLLKISAIDIYNKFYWIVVGAFSTIILSVISHALIRNVSVKRIFVITAVLAMLLSVAISIIYFYQAGIFQGVLPIINYHGYLGLAYFTLEIRYLVLGIVFALFALIILISMSVQLYKIRKQQKQPWQQQLKYVPIITRSQILTYFIFIILYLIHYTVCIIGYFWLITSIPKDSSNKIPDMFTQYYDGHYVQKILAWFVVFWAIFGGFFIKGFCQTVIALLYCKQLAAKMEKKNNILAKIFVNLLYRSFGSIVAASFLVPLLGKPIQMVLWIFVQNTNKARPNLQPSKILRLFSPGTYLWIGKVGSSYYTSSKQSHVSIWQKYDITNCKQRMQTQRLLAMYLKTISSLLFTFIFQCVTTFILEQRSSIFQQLTIIIILYLLGDGITDILICGVQNQTRINYINNHIIEQKRKNMQTEQSLMLIGGKRTSKINISLEEHQMKQKSG